MVGRLTPVITVAPSGIQVACSAGTLVASTGNPPPPTGPRINVANQETNGYTANQRLDDGALWVNQAASGDYVDRNGVAQGPTAFVRQVVAASPVVIDVSAIPGDFFITGIDVQTASLDGGPADAWWVAGGVGGSSSSLPLPSSSSYPTLVRNPTLTGRSLTLSTNSVGSTVVINQVQGPLIRDWLTYPAGYNSTQAYAAGNILHFEITNDAAVIAACGNSTGNVVGYTDPTQGGVAYEAIYQTEANGLQSLRFGDRAVGGGFPNVRFLQWQVPITPIASGYFAFCLYIEGDCKTGMNPASLGMKLPGPSNDDGTSSGYNAELISLRLEHNIPSATNPDVWGLHNYWYSAHGAAEQVGMWQSSIYPWLLSQLRSNNWYHIEIFFNLGTAGVANGTYTVWINGNQVLNNNSILFRGSSATLVSKFDVVFYQGGSGTNVPLGEMHYRIAKIDISSSRIGLPNELGVPQWRRNMTLANTLYTMGGGTIINNNAQLNPPGAAADPFIAFGGFAIGKGGASLWMLGNGGHERWQNPVGKLDLTQDAPLWLCVHQSSTFNNVNVNNEVNFDNTPNATHNYWNVWYAGDTSGKMIKLASEVVYTNLGQAPWYAVGFDPVTNLWDTETHSGASPWSESPYYYNSGDGTVAYDPAQDLFWVGHAGPVQRWATFNANTTQSFWYADANNDHGDQTGKQGEWHFFIPNNSGSSFWGFCGSCIDTTRHRWVFIHQTNNTGPLHAEWLDVSNPSAAYSPPGITMNITGTIASSYPFWANVHTDSCSLVYDADNDRYLLAAAIQPGGSGQSEMHLFSINTTFTTATELTQLSATGLGFSQPCISTLQWSSKYGGCFYASTGGEAIYFYTTRANA